MCQFQVAIALLESGLYLDSSSDDGMTFPVIAVSPRLLRNALFSVQIETDRNMILFVSVPEKNAYPLDTVWTNEFNIAYCIESRTQ